MSSNKRSLTVIKELQPPSPKKKLYVTHKLDASSVDEDDFAESLKGNPSPQVSWRMSYEELLLFILSCFHRKPYEKLMDLWCLGVY